VACALQLLVGKVLSAIVVVFSEEYESIDMK